MIENPELFIVAEDDQEIVVCCMGYLCENNEFRKKFISHNFISLAFRTALLVISENRVFYKRASQNKKSKDHIIIIDETHTPQEKGDLLSIFVQDSQRGTGVANNLLLEYENRLKQLNRNFCVLSVENTNLCAINFYKKNGYIMYKKYGESLQYGKILL